MALTRGERLGPYEILSPLGEGGMGVVYKARDTRLDRSVAIKVLRPAFVEDAGRLRRFEQEARAVALLQHPNVMTLYDVGTQDGSPYLVSEFLEGESFRTLLSRGPLPLRKALEYGREIAQGLAAAHERGIVHRDLKPENILLTKDARVKILDFGLAKLGEPLSAGAGATESATLSEMTQPGTVLGTAGYMSPEQVRGHQAGPRSDIFSFGAVLYEMLTGRRAFRANSSAETLVAILQQDPPELASAGAVVPPGLERVIRRCLEKDPALHFQSAQDLAFALETIGTLSGAVEPPTGLLAPARRSRRALIGASVVLLAAVTFAAGWFLARTDRPPSTFSFKALTFQPGLLSAARFTPDGQTILYSGRFGANIERVYTTRPGSAEFRMLDLPEGTTLLSVSSAGELAVRLSPPPEKPGLPVLARVPMAGGVPRPMTENVASADWSPDGKELAIVRRISGVSHLEFPIGTELAQAVPPNFIVSLRVSPKGDLVAFMERSPGPNAPGQVFIVDRHGAKRALTRVWFGASNLAWSAADDEVYFHGTDAASSSHRLAMIGSGPPTIRAVDLKGRERLVLKAFTELILRDASQGRLLLTQTLEGRVEVLTQVRGEAKERDLSWLIYSMPADLSADGKLLLFDETRIVGGVGGVFLRTTDGALPVRLGDGQALALSPDGAWAATVETKAEPSPIILMPTGPGVARRLKDANLIYQEARFFPDGQRLLARASEAGRGPRLYVQEIDSGSVRPITPEGVVGMALSPDGKHAAVQGLGGRAASYPVSGGDASELPGAAPGDVAVQWSGDGSALFVDHPLGRRHDIFRVDLLTGQRQLLRSLAPDSVTNFIKVLFTPDGRSHVFALHHAATELYLVEGAR